MFTAFPESILFLLKFLQSIVSLNHPAEITSFESGRGTMVLIRNCGNKIVKERAMNKLYLMAAFLVFFVGCDRSVLESKKEPVQEEVLVVSEVSSVQRTEPPVDVKPQAAPVTSTVGEEGVSGFTGGYWRWAVHNFQTGYTRYYNHHNQLVGRRKESRL